MKDKVLDSKADITEQLAWRDKRIAELEERLKISEITSDCKHGRPQCSECLDEAPTELLRLNPYARHDFEDKPPEDPAGKFIHGVRYYAGMLEDGDSWWHSLGHIESLCRDFDDAISERAGKPNRDENIKQIKLLIDKLREYESCLKQECTPTAYAEYDNILNELTIKLANVSYLNV